MSTRKIIAAVASVAILGSTIAVFQTSSRPRVQYAQKTTQVTHDQRPVTELEAVVVYASALPNATVGNFGASLNESAQADAGVPSLNDGALRFGSRLYMPYYSFASNLHTLIKE